ncbi:MAG: S4 domain-containing protein, partial [Mariprofundaceae bacterium]|nr:S4 domain-containing protein [Mariprofundaceae bacterium]
MASTEHSDGQLTVSADEDGSRLDRFLLRRLGNSYRSLIMRLVRKGNVRVSGKRAKPDTRLVAGDCVFLPTSLRAENVVQKEAGQDISRSLLDKVAALPVL